MSLFGALAEGVRQGKEVLTGRLEIATASETVVTPFATIDAVIVTREGDGAPGVTSSVFTYDVDGNEVDIYAWRPTSSSNPTLIAGNAAVTVSYVIIGRRR